MNGNQAAGDPEIISAGDPEIIAIRKAYEILCHLDTSAVERVLRWLTDRLRSDHVVEIDIVGDLEGSQP